MAELTMKVQKTLLDAKNAAVEEAAKLRTRYGLLSREYKKLAGAFERLRKKRKVRTVDDYTNSELLGMIIRRKLDKLFRRSR